MPDLPTTPPARGRWVLVGVLALLAYGIFIGARFGPYAGGSDSSGYFNSARLMTEGRLSTTQRAIPGLGTSNPWWVTPLGFVGSENSNRLVPTYPPGTPLHFALLAPVFGWHWGPLLAGTAAAVAAVWLCYLVGREAGLAPPLAAAGAAALASCPVFLFCSVQPLSDALAATWTLAATFGALRSHRPGAARWAVFCGAAFGVAVLARPSSVVLAPGLAVLLWRWPLLLRAAAGGLPIAIALGAYQHLAYGSALRSGYGGISGAFGLEYLFPSLGNFVPWTARLLPLAVLALPLAPFLPWRAQPRLLAGLGLLVLSLGAFYSFFIVSHEVWWYLRFLLPIYPALIVLALLGVAGAVRRHAGNRMRPWSLAAGTFLATASLANGAWWDWSMGLGMLPANERAYPDACRWTRDHLPGDSVVVSMQASGALWFYTDLAILRYDTVEPADRARVLDVLRDSGRPVFGLLSSFEEEEAMSRRLPGQWEKIAEIRSFGVWRWHPRP